MNKKYQVYYYDICTGESGVLFCTDYARTAINKFFKNQKHHPQCIAILANTYRDARELLEYVHYNHSDIEEIYQSTQRPVYRLDFILSEIDRKFDANEYLMEDQSKIYRDQIYPFSLG